MCKIRYLFSANGPIQNLRGMIGRLFYQKFYVQYLAYDGTAFIVIMKYSIKKRIKQITQKSFQCKKVNVIAPLFNKLQTEPQFSFWF